MSGLLTFDYRGFISDLRAIPHSVFIAPYVLTVLWVARRQIPWGSSYVARVATAFGVSITAMATFYVTVLGIGFVGIGFVISDTPAGVPNGRRYAAISSAFALVAWSGFRLATFMAVLLYVVWIQISTSVFQGLFESLNRSEMITPVNPREIGFAYAQLLVLALLWTLTAIKGLIRRFEEASVLMNVLVSVIFLGLALLGFKILGTMEALFWLILLIVGFPPALAFIIHGGPERKDLLELYRIGTSQIPIIGELIKHIWPSVNQRQQPAQQSEPITSSTKRIRKTGVGKQGPPPIN
jgi:hypothetical protein